jgi:gas vesicle protein
LILLLSAPSPADSKRALPTRSKGKPKRNGSLKKDSKKIGQDVLQSTKELPAQAGKEFKKTGNALKETGKELKESIKETVEEIKKTIKK